MLLFFCSGEKLSTNEWPRLLGINGKTSLSELKKYLEELPKSRRRAITVTICSVCGFIHLFVGWMALSFINIGNSILFLLLTHTHSCTCGLLQTVVSVALTE
jgi:hypothetical protein